MSATSTPSIRSGADIRLLVFDLNAIAYAAAYQPNLANLSFAGQPTGVIHGAINSFLATAARHPNALPVVLWDGHAAWRREINPGYKSNRSDKPEKVAVKEQVKAQTPAVQMLLHDLGAAQARHPHAEADDLAGRIATAAERAGIPTRMVTPDSDWWQAVSPMVDWQHSRDESKVITLQGLRSVTKDAPPDGWATPQEYLQAKIISGDASDCIAGIPGAGLATAAKILRTSLDGLDGILRGEFSAKGVVADRLRTHEARELLQRNRQIMDWAYAPAHDPDQMAVWAYPEDLQGLKRTAEAYGLSRLVGRVKPGMVRNPESPGMRAAWDVVVTALNWPTPQQDAETA